MSELFTYLSHIWSEQQVQVLQACQGLWP